jgi:hypothetical protein
MYMSVVHHVAVRRDDCAGGVGGVGCEPVDCGVIYNRFNDACANGFEAVGCGAVLSLVGC